MKIKYDDKFYRVRLIDDGTLDTVLNVEGKDFHFDSEFARNDDGSINDEAIFQAIETYITDLELST